MLNICVEGSGRAKFDSVGTAAFWRIFEVNQNCLRIMQCTVDLGKN